MKNSDKSKKDLIKELAELRQQISEMEASKIECMKVEEELRSSEEKWRLLYEDLPGGSFVINSQYLIQDVNDVLCETTGYKREELIGQLCDIICPKGPHKCPLFDMGKERIDNDKTAVKTKDGSFVPILKSARRIPLQGEELIVENFQDISETVRIEKELKESEALLENILSSSAIGIAYTDDRETKWTNGAMKRMFGYVTEEEYIGQNTRLVYPSDEEYERVGKIIYENVKAGKEAATDAKFVRKDGSVFDGHIKIVAPNPSKPMRGTIINIIDITERKQTEKALNESEKLLSNILAASPIGIAYSKERIIVWANESMAKMFGFEDENEYLGKSTHHLYVSDEEYQRVGKITYEGMMTGDLIETDAKFRRTDGSVFDGHVRVSVIDPSDPMKGIIVNILDITQRKKIEEELVRLSSAIKISNDSVVITDLSGKIIDANESTLKMCKIDDKNDLIGTNSIDIISPEESDRIISAMKEALREGYIQNREVNIIAKNGDKIPIEMSISLMKDKDGELIGFVAISRDITERKQAEKNLRFLSSITEQVTDSIVVTDTDFIVSYINKACEELYGYSKDKLIGKTPDILNAEPLADDIQRDIYQTVSSGNTWEGNHLNKRKDGSAFIAELKISPLYDEDGHIISHIGIQRDITKRIAAEEALQESEEKFRDLFETSKDIVYFSTLDGKFIDINPSGEELFGYTKDELLKIDVRKLYKNPEERIKFQSRIERDGFVKDYEITFKKKDGAPIECLLTSTLRKNNNGNVLGYQGIIDDITGKKRMENLLRESEEKFRSLFEQAADSITLINAETGELEDFNDKAYESLGYTREEFKKLKILDIDATHSAEDIDGQTKKIIKEGEDIFETKHRRKNGEIRNVFVSARKITIRGRNFILTICHDITERKRMEEQLLSSQKMEAIGTLVGGIAHDFNNILAMILGYSSFLKSKLKIGDPFYSGLDTIEQSAIRASNLTSQLLAYTRKARMEVKPIDLNRVLKEVYSFISKTFDKSIKIKLRTDSNLKTVEGDESQINQVLMNITVNAHDSMPRGGTLDIKTYMKDVKKEILKRDFDIKPGNYVCIKFTDTGIGMNEETVSRIFEPYFTTREEKGGTGLGMSVAFGIVKGHNGYIDVESRPDEGTEITVYFPASQKKEKTLYKEIGEVKGGNETILIIDDEKAILNMTKSILDELGYTTYTADSGREGIKIFNENDIDLIILDIKMPDMGGKEVLKKILENDLDAKVLLSSGYSEENQHHDLLEMGAKDFIGKPFVSDKLLLKIREVLD